MKPVANFTLDDAQKAADEWGANCGPGAIAAITGKTLEDIRPFLGDFEKKRYTNITLMRQILDRMGVKWEQQNTGNLYPRNGLVRVQWEGPWTEPGAYWAARQRHSHWIASRWMDEQTIFVFDINCICVGGWVPVDEWAKQVVPWLLRQVEPLASGRWYPTHKIEIERR